MDLNTDGAGIVVQTGVPLLFDSNGSQAGQFPGGFRTLTQPFEDGLFGTIVIVGVAHSSAPASAEFHAVVRNATTGEMIVTVPNIRVDDLQLEADQFSPDPQDHCSDLSETRGTTFQITLAPTVNEVLVAPTDNLQLELLPTAVFGGEMELCVDHPHHTGLSLVVEPLAPPNSPPVAVADSATTPKNTGTSINVLANDSDPDGNPLTVTNLSTPANGTSSLLGDGTVEYVPNPGFAGTDSFTYTAHDGFAESGVATVTITVVNHPPVALDDTATTFKNTPVTINVLANDSDPDGDALSVTNLGQPGFGSSVLDADDTVTYTPTAGVSGTDAFTYTANDGMDDSDPASVSVEVVNRPPDCSAATSTVTQIWSPDHRFVPVGVQGVTDPDGDAVTITFDSARQDEPTDTTGDGAFAPDAALSGSTAHVRAERSGNRNGRFYHLGFTADDGDDGTCNGTVQVSVPHDILRTPVDDGPVFDSTRH